MNLIINGEARRVESANLSQLLAELQQDTGALALARNGAIIPRAKWPQTPLADGDTIDLFSVIAGG